MTILNAFLLGAVQGVTEFLPISSSGHLVLGEVFLGLDVENLKSFDVAVHMASLLAIFVYFWKDAWGLIKAFFGLFVGGKKNEYTSLVWFIIIGTIPAVIIGFTLEDHIDEAFRNVSAVGLFMVLVGVIFLLGEMANKRVKKVNLGYKNTFIVGLAQACALIPGVSRSGSTIVTGLFQGVDRSEAARFSFLLGIPAILGAGLLTGIKVAKSGVIDVPLAPLLTGFVASFLFGLVSVWGLMKFLKKHTLVVFAVYLIIVGSLLLL